jgi:hypothetical protein
VTDIWSPNVTVISKSKRKLKPRDMALLAGTVVHTTGSGIVVKALKRGDDPLDYAEAYYARASSYASNYLAGHDFGRADVIVGTVPENLVAYHTSLPRTSLRWNTYKRGRGVWPRFTIATKADGTKYMKDHGKLLSRYADWLERWPDLDSPLDLISAPGTSINRQFLGVDMLAPEPGEQHTELQVRWVASLIGEIHERHGLPVTRRTVLRHADLDPFSRTSKRGGWDPPAYAFKMLCEYLEIGWLPEQAVA